MVPKEKILRMLAGRNQAALVQPGRPALEAVSVTAVTLDMARPEDMIRLSSVDASGQADRFVNKLWVTQPSTSNASWLDITFGERETEVLELIQVGERFDKAVHFPTQIKNSKDVGLIKGRAFPQGVTHDGVDYDLIEEGPGRMKRLHGDPEAYDIYYADYGTETGGHIGVTVYDFQSGLIEGGEPPEIWKGAEVDLSDLEIWPVETESRREGALLHQVYPGIKN